MIPSNSVPVSHIRSLIQGRKLKSIARDTPGIYVWWFKECDEVKHLLAPLEPIEWNCLQNRTIGNETYVALYFGISSKLRKRITWHVTQGHTVSNVSTGYLSTLRHTLSALLKKDATKAEQRVNDFIDAYCELSFENVVNMKVAEREEKSELSTNYYPLNIQGNKKVESSVLKKLKALRKQYRK